MNSNNEFLLEFFSEEIPAKLHRSAIEDAQSLFAKILKSFNVQYDECQAFVSPRRLVIFVQNMTYSTVDIETKRGPRIDAKQEFINGFLRTNNATDDMLIKDGDYYFLEIKKECASIDAIISQMISKFIDSMPWKKSMRWYLENESRLSAYWVRPVRSVMCLYNGNVVTTYLDAFGMTTSNKTYGHRFLTNNAEIVVSNFENYKAALEQNYVLIDFHKKRSIIETEIRQVAINMGGIIQDDNDLLDEVAGLVEYPFVHVGQIDEKFMHLPQLFITTVLKTHQKFFTIIYPDSVLLPFYIAVINVPMTSEINAGLEKVTNSRLSDAVFFYKEDTELTLDEFAMRLSNIAFHEKLGTIAQKIARMMLLTNNKQEIRTISICKADLATQIVGEMPELQGDAGEIYARYHGENESVCRSISEHYRPNNVNDVLPTSIIGARISLFDKLDTLVGFFGVGIYPTGTKDQFALRRAAYCIVKLLCDFEACDTTCDDDSKTNDNCQMHNPCSSSELLGNETITDYIHWLIDAYTEQGVTLSSDVCDNVLEFIADRLKVFINTSYNIPHNIIDIVVSSYVDKSLDYKNALYRCKQLYEFTQSAPEKFDIIKAAYKRATGIIQNDDNMSHADIRQITFQDKHQIALQDCLVSIHDSAEADVFDMSYNLSVLFAGVCDNVCIRVDDELQCAANIALVNQYIRYIRNSIGMIV